MINQRTNGLANGKVTSAPIEALEVKLNILLVNYDGSTNGPTDRTTDRLEVGKFHFR